EDTMLRHGKRWALLLIVLSLLFVGCGAGQSEAQTVAGEESQSNQQQGERESSNAESQVNTRVSVEQLQGQVEAVYADTSESVVNITSQVMSPGIFNQPTPQEGAGSGFIFDGAGHVVTNYHVVQKAESVSVSLSNGDVHEASVVGSDPFTDLAVLQIEADGLPAALSLADSGNLRVGQFVAAVGNPFNFEQTLTFGVISALGRVIRSPGGRFISEAIQTDTPINPGNSGGPLLNLDGEVIGVNSAIISPSGASAGVGFAISANTVSQVVPSLIEDGEYPHPWIGIQAIDLQPGLVRILNQTELTIPVEEGVLVVGTLNGGPAEDAGIQGGERRLRLGNLQIPVGGDVIVGINDAEIESYKDLVIYLETETEIGETITVHYYRGENERSTELSVGRRPEDVQENLTQ
ncbi:MAG: S1C family serine protease, partial [Spirochaetaceae bacterium]